MSLITLVMSYYRQPVMLTRQMENWLTYPEEVRKQIRFILVDDGSPQPAAPIVQEMAKDVEVYRVTIDILWNQNGTRNLAAHVADEGWMLMTDLDHVLLVDSAQELLRRVPALSPSRWYRLDRRRTRVSAETGQLETFPIKPHSNSFVVTREAYWKAGGYDEDYCGCLCGDGVFHSHLAKVATPDHLSGVYFDCYGRTLIPDATTPDIPRDQAQRDECGRRMRDKARRGDTIAKNPLRFPWERVL